MARKKYLDGLRGLAALGVVAFHSSSFFSAATWTETFGDVPNLVLSRFINGNFMVCIFFLLSGYVLTIPRAANPAIPSGYWGELIICRYFRLTPVAITGNQPRRMANRYLNNSDPKKFGKLLPIKLHVRIR